MASFKVASAVLLVAAAPTSHGFTLHAPAAARSARPLHATEAFQRSLLEAQLESTVVEHVAATATATEAAVNVDDESSAKQHQSAVDNMATQNSILRIAASTDRGQYAKSSQKDQVSQLVTSLESNAPSHEGDGTTATIPSYLTGTWELLYSNTQLFKSSPFFLAGRATCKSPEQAAQYNWFCDMHRAALAISTIGVVRQIITSEGKLVNEFETKVGAVPFLSDFVPFASYSGGLPFTINGAIVSTADATPISNTEWELFMDTVEIKGSNIPGLRNVLDSDNVALKSRDLSKVLEDNVESYEVPKPLLRTTYVDEGMRIVRDEDDNIFVYGRVSDSEEPTDYSGVMADFGIGSLLEGFNDAITKIYL